MNSARLVEQPVAARAVQAARRGEQEALDAGLLGRLGQAHRRVEVDVVGQIGVEVAERIVGERGEVDDRVEALEVLGAHVAEVDVELWDVVGRADEVAPVVAARCRDRRPRGRRRAARAPSPTPM